MNFANIRKMDIANGEGIRVSLFVSGCHHGCKGCFNQPYQDFHYGKVFRRQEEELLLTWLAPQEIKGLTLLGGEPFQNEEGLIPFLEKVRIYFQDWNMTYAKYPKDIWAYSGYTFEELLTYPKKRQLLEMIDVLVDGPFIEEEKDLRLAFRGSRNQRIIDVQSSLVEGRVVQLDYP